MCASIDSCLEYLAHDSNLAVGGSRQHILKSFSYSPRKIFCFDPSENIASYQPALLMRKDSPLKSRFNKVIRNAFEGGLFVKWNRDIQRKKKHSPPQEDIPTEILMEHLSGVIIWAYVFGCLMSFATFICEKIIFLKVKSSNRPRAWIYLEHFVDGERHYLKDLPNKLVRIWEINQPDFGFYQD